jgi:hypothetical protein
MFSWLTGDTRKSITNSSAPEGALTVYMILPDDTHLKEDDYEGYGVFGGRDFFGLVWQLNSKERPKTASKKLAPDLRAEKQAELDREFDQKHRGAGIDLAWSYEDDEIGGGSVIFPKFAEVLLPWASLPKPQRCPNQGFGGQEEEE